MIINLPKDIKFTSSFKRFNLISLILIIFSLILVFYQGLNLGIDFKGGTLIELRTDSSQINISEIRQSFLKMNLGDVSVKKFGDKNDYLVKIEKTNTNDKNYIKNINESLSKDLGLRINFRRTENVGPKVSGELVKTALIAICISMFAMLFYIWIRFEWQFSLAAITALTHDVLITLGIFSLLSYEVNLSIVAAFLTIVGYSLNDTVVIFDRIRENLRKYSKIPLKEISDISINETLSRTIITSATTLLALLAIFFFGGEILKGFSFAMIIGVIIGTYSSIFVATPILNYTKVNQKSVLKED